MQSKIQIDTSGISQEAKDRLAKDIEYFKQKYDDRSGSELTDAEADEILRMSIDDGAVDYGLMVVLGHDYIPYSQRGLPIPTPVNDIVDDWDINDERWETEFQAIMHNNDQEI